ncbi:anti-sigma factor [Gallaecimonas pentaromativorans]|uniref:Anti-sigma-K factor RskA n=1 Tax=Gallaecimonas pentaromativorans TaxID=584787 RepID=A0A3N1PMZ9_9GAMM|nr:anti-sigma factor [Gallaecimonas pentaromativorans]ROQ28521.1 anti-sigma-K factor RskA [Gallaecimonas pentaromativorans]
MPANQRYRNPELIQLLAGHYFLGTLRGRARDRFETLLVSEKGARQALVYWEQRLAPCYELVPELSPPERVWQRLQHQIAPAANSAPRPSWWMAAAAIVLAVLLTWQWAKPGAPLSPQVAVIQGGQSQPLWAVKRQGQQLQVKALGEVANPDKDYQLWLVSSTSGPLSLGLLPQAGSRTLAWPSSYSGKQLAVSLEPVGGSPTGQPTGPVLYLSQLVVL